MIKKIFDNRKNKRRGVSGVDIAIAIGIVALGVGVTTGIIRQINSMSVKAYKKSNAARIAENASEVIKVVSYNDVGALISNPNAYISTLPGYTIIIENNNGNITPRTEAEAVDKAISITGNIKVKYNMGKKAETYLLPYKKYQDRTTGINLPKNLDGLGYTPVIKTDKDVFRDASDILKYYSYDFKSDITKYARDKQGNIYKYNAKTSTASGEKQYLFSPHNLGYKYITSPISQAYNSSTLKIRPKTLLPPQTPNNALGEWEKLDLKYHTITFNTGAGATLKDPEQKIFRVPVATESTCFSDIPDPEVIYKTGYLQNPSRKWSIEDTTEIDGDMVVNLMATKSPNIVSGNMPKPTGYIEVNFAFSDPIGSYIQGGYIDINETTKFYVNPEANITFANMRKPRVSYYIGYKAATPEWLMNNSEIINKDMTIYINPPVSTGN